VDVNISKKWKVIILIGVVIAAAPLYLLSASGMERQVDALWDRADDEKTPDRLLTYARVYNATWREEECQTLLLKWIEHYGGDETEKEQTSRYISWQPYPYNGDDHPRPAQHGMDYRKEPHPQTARVLFMIGERLERTHSYGEMKHTFKLILDDPQGLLKPDADIMKRAQLGIDRNSSGRSNY